MAILVLTIVEVRNWTHPPAKQIRSYIKVCILIMLTNFMREKNVLVCSDRITQFFYKNYTTNLQISVHAFNIRTVRGSYPQTLKSQEIFLLV